MLEHRFSTSSLNPSDAQKLRVLNAIRGWCLIVILFGLFILLGSSDLFPRSVARPLQLTSIWAILIATGVRILCSGRAASLELLVETQCVIANATEIASKAEALSIWPRAGSLPANAAK